MKQRIQYLAKFAERECEVGALRTQERIEFEHNNAVITNYLKNSHEHESI